MNFLTSSFAAAASRVTLIVAVAGGSSFFSSDSVAPGMTSDTVLLALVICSPLTVSTASAASWDAAPKVGPVPALIDAPMVNPFASPVSLPVSTSL
jgi:hypothetical protein